MKLRLKYQLCFPNTYVCNGSMKRYAGLSLPFFSPFMTKLSGGVAYVKIRHSKATTSFLPRDNLRCGELGHLLQVLPLQTWAGMQQCLGLCWAVCGWEEMSTVPLSPVTPVVTFHPGWTAGGCRQEPVFVHRWAMLMLIRWLSLGRRWWAVGKRWAGCQQGPAGY